MNPHMGNRQWETKHDSLGLKPLLNLPRWVKEEEQGPFRLPCTVTYLQGPVEARKLNL